MFDLIPFDIQSEIMKRLPVKSLVQFRSVSKQWKSLIDSAKFIKNYHINHTNPQHHLLVRYDSYTVLTYISIIDNNTFPQQKFPLAAPESLSLLRHTLNLGSVNGLLCFCGFYGVPDPYTMMAVMWNPTLRKSVSIVIHVCNGAYTDFVGYGACRGAIDPKLVKISVSYKRPTIWVVEVFTLSTRVWKTVYTGAPFKSCNLEWLQVFVDGVIYIRAYDYGNLDAESRFNFLISFDFESEKFGEVYLPERLVHAHFDLGKVNDSLALLEYYLEGRACVCGVWTRKNGANELFTKLYNVKVGCKWLYRNVLGFRNNGEVVTRIYEANSEEYGIKVYDPLLGRTNVVGIKGRGEHTFGALSLCIETLLLLDESDSTIH